jgi:hypothetical protein
MRPGITPVGWLISTRPGYINQRSRPVLTQSLSKNASKLPTRFREEPNCPWEISLIDATIIRDVKNDPEKNAHHIVEHGITVEGAEEFQLDPRSRTGKSRRSGRPEIFGTSTGKYITVVWEGVSDDPRMIYLVTANQVHPPQAGN